MNHDTLTIEYHEDRDKYLGSCSCGGGLGWEHSLSELTRTWLEHRNVDF